MNFPLKTAGRAQDAEGSEPPEGATAREEPSEKGREREDLGEPKTPRDPLKCQRPPRVPTLKPLGTLPKPLGLPQFSTALL